MPIAERWSAWNVAVDSDDVPGYLEMMKSAQKKFKKNGLDNVSMTVWRSRTGNLTSHLIASVIAPNRQTLGEALDQMREPWFQELLQLVSKTRKLVQGFLLGDCYSVYSTD